jgi:hypothetical protein
MMFTLLLPVAICVLALLMLRHAYARACRDYIEQRQLSAGARTSRVAARRLWSANVLSSLRRLCCLFRRANAGRSLRRA